MLKWLYESACLMSRTTPLRGGAAASMVPQQRSYAQYSRVDQNAHIYVHDLNLEFGTKTLFDGLGFQMGGKDTITLVGDNGCGKSTLMKLIAGIIPPSAGIVRAKGRIAYLPQSFEDCDRQTGMDHLIQAFDDMSLMAHSETPSHKRSHQWFKEFKRLGGSTLLRAAYELGLTEAHLNRYFVDLSGGEKVKVHLAALRQLDADILLLDEPTNHLDQSGAAWVERFIQSHRGLTIMVSHDRALINNTDCKIAELCPFTHRLHFFSGGYQQYLDQQQREIKRTQKKVKTNQAEIRVLQKRKDKLNYAATQQAKMKIKRLQKAKPEAPHRRKAPNIIFSHYSSADVSLSLMDLSKYTLFSGVNASLGCGDRLVITGTNGTGKTTLLEIISGLQEPDEGGVHFSPGINLAYFDQEQKGLDLSLTPVELLRNTSDHLRSETEIISRLASFGLYHEHDYYTPLKSLSMGARRKSHLAQLFSNQPNILLLDEPTNHLDLVSAEQIEAQLLSFPGIIIAVSHDRFFIQKIATDVMTLDTMKPNLEAVKRATLTT